MGQLEEIEIFIRVVEAGGVGKAAEQLGLAKSAVSRRLADLEERIGTKLISRTTRTSSLTDAGRVYYDKSLALLEAVLEMDNEVSHQNAQLQGRLKLSVPLSFGLLHLTPAIQRFVERHPYLKIDLDFTDRQVNLVEEGLDLAVRIADLTDSSIQARKLFEADLLLLAAPDYLDEKGRPDTFADLENLDFLRYSHEPRQKIQMLDANGVLHELSLKGDIGANNGEFLCSMAIAKQGCVVLPRFLAWQALANGLLEVVLPSHTLRAVAAYVVYPQNRFLPQKSRLFIDFLVGYFAEQRVWELPE